MNNLVCHFKPFYSVYPNRFWIVYLLLTLGGIGWNPSIAIGQVANGLDVLIAQNFIPLKGKKIGLITNQTGVSKGGRSSILAFYHSPHLRLVKLFAPEHGMNGALKAGDKVPTRKDPQTGLTIYSLYGDTRKPTPQMLSGLDALVYDIQDIGCRSYTFISTLGLAMQAAAERGIEFYVLDRPNPLGGDRIEGPPLDPKFRSFVGQYDVPYVYGFTPGEMANWINHSAWIGKPCKLTVVPMKGWQRNMTWEQTGLRWVPPSPNIPEPLTSAYYVATGWLGEAGGFDNGIGGGQPFKYAAAGWLNAERYAAVLNSRGLEGVKFRPIEYKLIEGKYKGEKLQGVRIEFVQFPHAHLSAIGPHLIDAAERISGRNLFARANREKVIMFDKVTGGSLVRNFLTAKKPVQNLIYSWQSFVEKFKQSRESFLLYH